MELGSSAGKGDRGEGRCLVRKSGCVLAGLGWGELLVRQVLSWDQGQMITKALLGDEKTKEACCNKVFKTFCSAQLYWMLAYEVSCPDVPWFMVYVLYKCRSMTRLLEDLPVLLL